MRFDPEVREQNGNSLPYSCLENPFHGQRSLAGCIPWSRKEQYATEQLSMCASYA